MSTGSGPYLVQRRDDGYGDVFPLQEGQRVTLGRANTNRVVLKDELCSREHAEVYFAEDRWQLRDLKSLNGTHINGTPLKGDWELTSGDEFQVGRSRFVFVDQLEDLPDVPAEELEGEGISIKKRLGQTRFLTPVPEEPGNGAATGAPSKHSLSRDLSLLYRLALDMGTAPSYPDLAKLVLDALMEATPAEVGAILTVVEGRNLEVTAQRQRDPKVTGYLPVSEFVSNEVRASREAILAEDVARDRYLKTRESLHGLGATSLICAPVVHQGKVTGLIHLYCKDPLRALSNEDLEFTVAVAKQLAMAAHQVQQRESLASANESLREQLKVESELVGESAVVKKIHEQIGRVADTHATVLIRGESGVGKELVARAIHYSSPRREGPFVCLNCAAITETLLESELFGHEKGAFTGATEKKIGKFEAAHQGTIFLDEIGEMSVGTQAKLLRILEGHPFERVGGGAPIRVDVRVVAATNQALEKNIQAGRFRKDLFYRLQVVEMQVPPLRERPSDVPLLADFFLKRFVRETGRKIRGFTEAAQAKMADYAWPGNVRELRNVVERAVALGHGPYLDAKDVWLSSLEVPEQRPAAADGEEYRPLSLEDIEKMHIARTLAHTEWNKSQAAHILHIERSTLDRKIKTYGIQKE
jgi:transcriptional regulator with GAF, ATPase, and Fis domain